MGNTLVSLRRIMHILIYQMIIMLLYIMELFENYRGELKDKLVKNGYEFYSSTDTEVAIKLIDYYYKKYEHTL